SAVALLSAALPSAYYDDPNLHDLLCCRIVALGLRHGNTDQSSHGYVTFGATLGRLFGRWDLARRFGSLARELVDSRGFSRGKASAYYTAGVFINGLIEPIRDVLPLVQTAIDAAIEYGDLNHACFGAEAMVMFRLFAGDPLDRVAEEAERQLLLTRRSRHEAMHRSVLEMDRLIRRLRGVGPGICTIKESASHGSWAEPGPRGAEASGRPPLVAFSYQTLVRFMAGDFEQAAAASLDADRLGAIGIDLLQAEHCFYAAMSVAAAFDRLPTDQREDALERLLGYQERYREWETHGPENFASRSALISAEIARIQGREIDAIRLYERAVVSARGQGFANIEGIANERAAEFHEALGLGTAADAYRQQARACY
ncbi:hypothetical protein ACYOEI_36220, partial [Singulisphaera rosea]